jgi:hypothetical protein
MSLDRNNCRALGRKYKGNKSLGILRLRWEDNVRMYSKEFG